MADASVNVDARAIEDLTVLLDRAGQVSIRRIAERGEQLLRKEAPKVTSNLRQGVSSDVEIAPGVYKAELIVSARAGRRGARPATVYYPSGATKAITLKDQPAYDYAEVVARGRKAIAPKRGQALLIPVSNPPVGEAYITSGGQTFIVRRRAKGTRANPYDERALQQLARDAVPIVEAQLQKAGLTTS